MTYSRATGAGEPPALPSADPTSHKSAEARERKAGAQEYLDCRRNPSGRHLSWLAQAGNRSTFGLWILGLNVRHARVARLVLHLVARIPGLRALACAAVQVVDRLAGASDAAGGWDELRAFFWQKLPILVYHDVGPYVPGTFRFLSVEPAIFARHLDWLRRKGFTTIHLRDWTNWLDRGDPLPKRPAILTFDDGYAHIARYALPELQTRGMRATVYVVTSRIGGINSWDQQYVRRPHALMGAEEIRFWFRNGVEMGCHTRTHRRLIGADQAVLKNEIRGSARDLTVLLNSAAGSFAYPYGIYDEEALEHVSANFRSAVTTLPGVNSLWTPRHELRRANVDPQHEWFDFSFLLWLGWGPYESLHVFLARKKQRLIDKVRKLIPGLWPL